MPYKDPEKRKEYHQQYYQDHKDQFLEYGRKRRKTKSNEIRKYNKKWQNENKDQYNTGYRRRYKNKLRKALEIYNNKCQECGVDNIIILQFHHIKGRGNEQTASVIGRIVKENGVLSDIDLLCANCHILADIRDKTGVKGLALTRLRDELNNEL